MSVRDAHDGAGKPGFGAEGALVATRGPIAQHGLDERRGASSGGERRGGVGQRVHFEALVAMGEPSGGAGFEAESVDVSPEGMRLRTAYLPEVGDKLLCRFDGMGTEVTAEGEVIWCREEARGGEFGLRFLGYDDHAAEALRGMCAALSTQHGEGAPAAATAMRGTRVRLHIEGLAAPMKARVREAAGGEIQVGSNLEFLRVGRPLEVEDVDYGAKRQAMIDHVRVEVDPVTRVPQLVVALRVEGAAKPQASKAHSAARLELPKPDIAAGAMARAGTLPYGVHMPSAPDGAESVPVQEGVAGRSCRISAPDTAQEANFPTAADMSNACPAAEDIAAQGAGNEEADEPDDAAGPARGEQALRSARDKAMAAGTRVAEVVGPALSGVGSRAKGAVSGLLTAIRQRRAAKAEAHAGAHRRTTAPPPSGVLKADGRRLVRDRDDAGHGATEPPESAVPMRSKRKAALLGSVLGLLAILSLFAGYRIFGRMSNASAPTAPESAATVAAAPPASEAPAAAGSAASGVPTAAVPLFGATPLSTTEPVPPPAAETPAVAEQDGDGDDDSADGDDAPAAPDKPGQKQWGQGSVKNPVVLKLKMDGEIASLTGAAGAMGFTLSVPGRRSLSSATDLARKDKRIASIQVVNNPQGAEVSVQFKNGVPAYLARAKGSRLEIVLGSESRKKVAKSTTDKSAKKKAEPPKKKAEPPKKKSEADAKSKTTKDKAKTPAQQ